MTGTVPSPGRPPSDTDDERLLEILHAHCAGGTEDLEPLLRQHPEDREALIRLHDDYRLALGMMSGGRGARETAGVIAAVRRAAASCSEYHEGPLLARGGMAEIHHLYDARLGRRLVKKVLPISVHDSALTAASARRLRRFLDEALIMSALQHPAILTVVDFGLDERGRPFIAMPEVEGRTLAAVFAELRGGRGFATAMATVVRVVTSVCEAVAHAHAAGVMHRDLKPSNVMVGRLGEVRIMDWGLAKRIGVDDAASAAGSGASDVATRTGDQLGTPAYMAPEQARGDLQALGPHTDQYALGAILYEGLTGHRPYQDRGVTDTAGLLAAIRAGEPTPAVALDRRIPVELGAIVTKALALLPEHRYRSVAALADDLRAWMEARVVRAYGFRPWRGTWRWVSRRPWPVLGLGAAVGAAVIMLAVGAGLWSPAGTRADVGTGEEAELSKQRYRYLVAHAERLLDEDGSTAAITTALERCPPTQRGWEWRYLSARLGDVRPAFTCESGINRLAIAGDGSCIAVGHGVRVEVWEPSPARRRFANLTKSVPLSLAVDAGAGLVVATTANGWVQAWDLTTGDARWERQGVIEPLVEIGVDGSRVFCIGTGRHVWALDSRSGQVVGDVAAGAVRDLTLSPAGEWLAVAVDDSVRLLSARTLEVLGEMGGLAGFLNLFQFDPLGRQLHVDTIGGRRIVRSTPDGALLHESVTPVWLPPGRRRSVWRDRLIQADDCALTLHELDGSGVTVLSRLGVGVTWHASHPAVDWVVCGGADGAVHVADPRARSLWLRIDVPNEVLWVVLSPDGGRLAATGRDRQVRVWNVRTGTPLASMSAWHSAKRALAWTPDSTGLLGVAPDGRLVEWDAGT